MLAKLGTMTNATKAQVIALVNAVLGILLAFHVVLTTEQLGAVQTAVNAGLGLIVAMTFTQSSKRVQEPPAAPQAPSVGGA